jgi:uncharacterized protein (DUF111 family)
LFDPARQEAIESTIFRKSSTFGFRIRTVWRRVLDREIISVETPFGACRVKLGRHRGQLVQIRPEYEDVAALARANGRALPEIEASAVAAYLAGAGPARPPS